MALGHDRRHRPAHPVERVEARQVLGKRDHDGFRVPVPDQFERQVVGHVPVVDVRGVPEEFELVARVEDGDLDLEGFRGGVGAEDRGFGQVAEFLLGLADADGDARTTGAELAGEVFKHEVVFSSVV